MKSVIVALLTVALISMSGCAIKNPTFGDRILAEGESKIEISKQWEQGKDDSRKGENQVLKGRKMVENGRSDLRKGEQLIAAGNVEVQTNRQAYQGLSQISQATDSAEMAFGRAARLKKIAKDWEDGEEKIQKGNDLIHRGNTQINKGESEIQKGQLLIKQGRSKMQDAENSYHQEHQ